MKENKFKFCLSIILGLCSIAILVITYIFIDKNNATLQILQNIITGIFCSVFATAFYVFIESIFAYKKAKNLILKQIKNNHYLIQAKSQDLFILNKGNFTFEFVKEFAKDLSNYIYLLESCEDLVENYNNDLWKKQENGKYYHLLDNHYKACDDLLSLIKQEFQKENIDINQEIFIKNYNDNMKLIENSLFGENDFYNYFSNLKSQKNTKS